jgi:hypothetical protein
MTFSTFCRLVDLGAVIPDIYVRDKARWLFDHNTAHALGYLSALFRCPSRRSLCLAKGERVDEFFKRQFPGYASPTAQYGDRWLKVFAETNDSEKGQILAELNAAGNHPLDDITKYTRSLSYWIAYLDALRPPAAQHVWQLVDDGKVRQAVSDLCKLKMLVASPVSVAIGGEFQWPPDILADVDQRLFDIGGIDSRTIAIRKQNERVRNFREFAVSFLIPDPRHMSDVRLEAAALDILEYSPLTEINLKLQDFEKAFASTGELSPNRSLTDMKQLYNEKKRILGRFEKMGQVTVGADTLVLVPDWWELLGVDGLPSAVFGSWLGRLAHFTLYPDIHRMLGIGHQLTMMARKSIDRHPF